MAKKTNITNVINVNSIGQESFTALLDVQQKSVEHLETMSDILRQSLMAHRSSVIEEIIAAKSQEAQTQIFKDISSTLENIAVSLKSMSQSVAFLASNNLSSSKAPSGAATVGKEEKQEKDRLEQQQTSVLTKIEENTRAGDKSVKKGEVKEASGNLGLMLTAIAAALGAAVGAVQAQIKTIKYFATVLSDGATALFKGMRYLIEILTPEALLLKVQKAISSFAAGISMSYDLFKVAITEKISSITKAVDGIIDGIKVAISEKFPKLTSIFDDIVKSFNGIIDSVKVAASEKLPNIAKIFDNVTDTIKAFFTVGAEESTMTKMLKSIMSGLDTLLHPFVEAFKVVKDLFSGPTSATFEFIKGLFTSMGSLFDDFAKVFKFVASTVGKLLVPLNVIVTLWDTVKGAIEGYEEEGIIGGIRGAITGFFNSLIFGPLDMLKSAIAWVLGFFGFEKAKEVLNSFNLEDMFKEYVKMIFSPIETFKILMSKIEDFFMSLKGFEIPGFGFTAPKWIPGIGGKEFKFGPWYPFGKTLQQKVADTIPSSNAADLSTQVSPNGRDDSSLVSSGSTTINTLRENKVGGTTTVVAPAINNVNNSQTQVARIEAPVRNNDSTYDRYMYEKVGW